MARAPAAVPSESIPVVDHTPAQTCSAPYDATANLDAPSNIIVAHGD